MRHGCLGSSVTRAYIVTTSSLIGEVKGNTTATDEKGCGATRGSSCVELNVRVGGELVS